MITYTRKKILEHLAATLSVDQVLTSDFITSQGIQQYMFLNSYLDTLWHHER